MVVKIQTVDGKIREYRTVYSKGSGEYSPQKYVTKCGREWENKPSPFEECDHLECAISIAKSDSDSGPCIFMLFLAFAGLVILWCRDMPPFEFLGFRFNGLEVLGFEFSGSALIFFGFYIIFAIHSLISGLNSGTKFDELKEFERERKIKGVRAWRIYDS